MHVLYIHQYFSTPKGSTGTRSYEFSKKLIASGHTVTVVCGNSTTSVSGLSSNFVQGKRIGTVDGINVIEFDLLYSNHASFLTRTKLFFLFSLKCIVLALTLDYDLLFATTTPLTAGIPGIVMKVFRKKPFIFEVRDLWPELPREMGVIKNPIVLWLMGLLEWLSYHSADACIGLSPGIVEGIAKRNISRERITMIPNGCDTELFKPKLTNEKIRSIEGIGDDDFIALFSGAHGMANGLDAVLDAAQILISRNESKIKLLFVGDGKKKPDLLRRAEEQKLHNCIFVDSIPKYEMSTVTARADVGLMVLSNVKAFYNGTSPNKFFDYISSGIPVLNNYPGWLAEIITHNECGIAIPPEDPDAFAEALIFLYNNPEKKKKMGKKGRVLAENEFNRDTLSSRFVLFLESMHRNSSRK